MSHPEDNAFALLGLVPRFEIDADQLRANFLAASARHHPDRFSDPIEQADAVETMAKLTQAYRTLQDPVSRAQALLELAGFGINLGPGSRVPKDQDQLPPGLLMEMMELREALEDAAALKDHAKLAGFKQWADQAYQDHLDQLAECFVQGLGTESAAQARATLNALRYLQRLRDEIPRPN